MNEPSANTLSLRQLEEELANRLTHGLGLALAIGGLVFLCILTSDLSLRQFVGCTIYGASLVVLYAASTVYHSVRHAKAKRIFRMLDHACIFLLIAGTYTPFMLVLLPGRWGMGLLIAVWTLAAGGILFKIRFGSRYEVVSLVIYVLMGWLAVVATKPILEHVPLGCVLLLLAGGLAYTFGVVFYARDYIPYYHAIWHLFVLAGSAIHFVAVLLYVVPAAA